MELGAPRGASALKQLRLLVVTAFATLAALLVVVLVHGFVPDSSLLVPAEVLTWVLTIVAVASLAAGVRWAWLAHPKHKRAIVFVVAITLATLLAHAYIIGVPAATVAGTATGQVGSTLDDGKIRAVITESNAATVDITLTATGGAIAQANVTGNGVPLTGRWNTPEPSFASPLQQGTSTSGSFSLLLPASKENISISYQKLNCYDAGHRFYGCIMDEIFYVPEGMGILAGQHCSTGAGAPSDCHPEHPPLVPALLAAGMAMFGEYNVVGWRVMPALLGTFSIPLLFGIAWKVSESKKVAYLSATLFALDVMFFSQSSGGLLDVPEVFFALAAFFVYFARLRVWKLDSYVLAGVFLGLAGLAKETAVFIAMGFATYVYFFGEGSRRARVDSILKVALVVGLVFAGGLQAYDSALGSQQYTYFYQHVGYILSYGSNLIAKYWECQGGPHSVGYWCKFPAGGGNYAPILPTDWLTYYSPITYYGVSVCPNSVNGVCQGGSYEAVAYYGVTNLLVTWTVFVWVPLVVYALYRYHRRPKLLPDDAVVETVAQPETTEGDVRFGGLALIMFLWGYVPYLFLLAAERVTYPFYVIPAIPAMAMGASFWLSRSWFPRWLLYIYLTMVFVFFLVYFPEKGFLPVWLRQLIGH